MHVVEEHTIKRQKERKRETHTHTYRKRKRGKERENDTGKNKTTENGTNPEKEKVSVPTVVVQREDYSCVTDDDTNPGRVPRLCQKVHIMTTYKQAQSTRHIYTTRRQWRIRAR